MLNVRRGVLGYNIPSFLLKWIHYEQEGCGHIICPVSIRRYGNISLLYPILPDYFIWTGWLFFNNDRFFYSLSFPNTRSCWLYSLFSYPILCDSVLGHRCFDKYGVSPRVFDKFFVKAFYRISLPYSFVFLIFDDICLVSTYFFRLSFVEGSCFIDFFYLLPFLYRVIR